jgi:hypothetical protein
MTDIEELLRESLRTAPGVTPAASDPMSVVAARVRRVRAWWGGGVAVAVAAAAIAVPLALAGGTAPGAGRLVPAAPTPTSTSTLPPGSEGPTVWDRRAAAVAAGGGWLWELQRDAGSNNGSGHLIKLDPATHKGQQSWAVAAPYDFMTYGLGRLWIWGGGDGAYPDGLLQVIDPSQDRSPAATVNRAGVGFGDVAFVNGDAWATTGDSVWQIDAAGHVLSRTPVGSSAGRIVAAGGSLWVGLPSDNAIQEVAPRVGGPGAHAGLTQATADGQLILLAGYGADQLVISNGDDVRTEPLPRAGGEGGPGDNSVPLPGKPTAVVELPNGHLVVAGGSENGPAGVYVLTAATFPGGCSSLCSGLGLPANVLSLVVNPAGGVELVLDDGTAEFWRP